MVDYMSLEEQVDADFGRARRKAVLGGLRSRLRGDTTSGRLSCFEDVRKELGAAGGVRLGLRTVRSTDIVGSAGRCEEFDGDFLPISKRARTRWERVDRAFLSGEELPPVSPYKIGGSYFVEDGNHRVSVARYHGAEWLDAYVTEFRVQPPRNGRESGAPTDHTGAGVGRGARGERVPHRRAPSGAPASAPAASHTGRAPTSGPT